jgi:copper(I)-binding protein
MSTFRLVVSFLLALLAGPVLAHDAKLGDMVIMGPWARATIGQVRTGAAYLTVVNHGATGDRLLAVSTPVAAEAQLHSNTMDEGVMKMRPLEAVEIPAKGSAVLEPGGFHVMLMGVKAPLEEGDAFPMTLTFETAGSVEVEVHVQGIAAMHGGSAEEGSHTGHAEAKGGHDQSAHQHGKIMELQSGPTAPTLDFAISEDQGGGWNLQILTTNFRFAPEHVSQPHHEGEGHAHLYVNGEKVARVYGPWFHIGSLPSGPTEVTVILNSNDHQGLAVGGEALSVTKKIHVP